MEFLSIISFLAAAIVLTLMPGPDNMFTLAQSIGKGKKQGFLRHLGFVYTDRFKIAFSK